MLWYVTDVDKSFVHIHHSWQSATESACLKIDGHVYKETDNFYIVRNIETDKTLYVMNAGGAKARDFRDILKTSSQPEHHITSKLYILEQCTRIHKEHGHEYFIPYPYRKSIKFTGEEDYYQLIYEVHIIEGAGVESSTFVKKHQLERELDENLNNLVAVDVKAERVVQGDIVGEEYLLCRIKCSKYSQYKHKI